MKKITIAAVWCCSLFALTACVSVPDNNTAINTEEAARSRITLGLNYLQRGNQPQALYNLEQAKNHAPDMAEVYMALAYYYQVAGEIRQADQSYQQALSKDATNPDIFNNYAVFLCQQGQPEYAEKLLLKAITAEGYLRISESYENLALCQMKQQKFDAAMTSLEQAVAHNSHRYSPLFNLAALYYASGNLPAAAQQLQQIEQHYALPAPALLLAYQIANAGQQPDIAEEWATVLQRRYPDSAEAVLLQQKKLYQSEFEQLKARYQQQ